MHEGGRRDDRDLAERIEREQIAVAGDDQIRMAALAIAICGSGIRHLVPPRHAGCRVGHRRPTDDKFLAVNRAMLMARAQAGDREADYRLLEGHHAVSVTAHFSPSHAIVSTTSLPSATAVVEIEASVFEPAQKPRHSHALCQDNGMAGARGCD